MSLMIANIYRENTLLKNDPRKFAIERLKSYVSLDVIEEWMEDVHDDIQDDKMEALAEKELKKVLGEVIQFINRMK